MDKKMRSSKLHSFPSKTGAMIMKSVSIFLASGRRASRENRQSKGKQSDSSGLGAVVRMEDVGGKINSKTMELFKRRTHFNKSELESLCRIYKKLLSNCQQASRTLAAKNPSVIIAKPHALVEGIDRTVFREVLHNTFDIVTEEAIMERIFCSWEKGHEGLPLRLEGWLTGLSTFLRGTLSEKAAFCFRVYDLNCDGYITKDEIFTLLRNCLIKQPQDEDPDEGVRDLVEIILKKFDVDKDGKVSFRDFIITVTEQPLLLEAFGQCLPTENSILSFLQTL